MTDTAATARPLGDPFGRFADATSLDEYAYASRAMLGFVIAYIGKGDGLEESRSRDRLFALMYAIDNERSTAINRILDGDTA